MADAEQVASALGLLRRTAAETARDTAAEAAGDTAVEDTASIAPWVVAVARLVVAELGLTTVVGDAPLLAGVHGEAAPLPAALRAALSRAVAAEGVDLLGLAHEALLASVDRRRRGAFYTPRAVAEGLVAVAGAGWRRSGRAEPLGICDPACGGGAFLLAAARWRHAAGVPARQLAEEDLSGVDLDPLAAAVADATLRTWAAAEGAPVESTRISVGDALAPGRPWSPGGLVDLVVGNPPFQNQLEAATVRSAEDHADLRDRFGEVARPYADTSSLFLGAALAAVAPAGRVALLLPESFLSARDAGGARAALLEQAELVGLWAAGGRLFTASVRVVGVVAERPTAGPSGAARSGVDRSGGDRSGVDRSGVAPRGGGRSGRGRPIGHVARWVGPERHPAPARAVGLGELDGRPWGALVADLVGVPPVELDGDRCVGDLATATAGFRHQFYGLAPFVVEADPTERRQRAGLVVSGLIDPANLRWGRRPARFAGRTWVAPEVDLAALALADPALARWGRARLRPKVLVATQTRVVEAVVDEAGAWWPSVPIISVEPADPADLWRLAAVLLAPPVSAWARGHLSGSALSADAVKLAARQVQDVPLPPDREAWERGARAVEAASAASRSGDAARWRASLLEAGAVMCEAYGTGGDVLAWWVDRLPPHR